METIHADSFELSNGLGSPVGPSPASKSVPVQDDTFSLHLPDISSSSLASAAPRQSNWDPSSLRIPGLSPRGSSKNSTGLFHPPIRPLRRPRTLMGLPVKARSARSQTLTGLLDVLEDDNEESSRKRHRPDDNEDEREFVQTANSVVTDARGSTTVDKGEGEEDGVPDSLNYDAPRKKVKRRHSRIARPRDSMPGFRRSRGGGGWRGRRSGRGGSRFSGGGNTSVGARHLDRGISRAAYFGGAAVGGGVGGDVETGATESSIAEELALAERSKLAERDGDLGALGAMAVPVCPAHSIPCKKLVTKKGKNKGRPFFACGHERRYEQCDFFAWADEKAPVLGVDDFGEYAGCTAEDFVIANAVVECDDPAEVDLDEVGKKLFGFDELRDGQREAVGKLRKEISTLAIFATGGGKSLVYQMYAALVPGVVLVITPLVSLMRNQEDRMPSCLPCACLRGGQELSVVEDVEHRLKNGLIKVLIISPERLFTRRFRALVKAAGDKVFSAVVVDEAHCISEWSHNFRTSYLRLSRVFFGGRKGENALFTKPPTLLALTATATQKTTEGICQSLRIEPDSGVVRSSITRDNLTLGVTVVRGGTESSKAHELVRVLTTEPYASVLKAGLQKELRSRVAKDYGWGASARELTRKSKPKRSRKSDAGAVLIYVSKQRECANVCNFLRTSNLLIGRVVAMYHAGMGAHERSKAQKDFQEGRVCILVATVAFGMGLDVANVRAVIHYDLPFSLESYAQEVGRAGRDGKPAVCHALVSQMDRHRLVSRAYSDGVEVGNVKKFVMALLASKKGLMGLNAANDESKNAKKEVDQEFDSEDGESEGLGKDDEDEPEAHFMHISYADLDCEHDMRTEGAETIVAILERAIPGVELMPSGHARMVIQFFSQTPLAMLSPTYMPPLSPAERRILTAVVKHSKSKGGVYDLQLATAGLLEEDVGRGLRRLSAARSVQFEMKDMSLRVRITGSAAARLSARAASLATEAAERLARIEAARVGKAREVTAAFLAAENELSAQRQSEMLHQRLCEYFAKDAQLPEEPRISAGAEDPALRRAVGAVLGNRAHGRRAPKTAREVARILHGIQSPAFTAKAWYGCSQWRKWVHVEFAVVKSVAASVIRSRLKRGTLD